ncbi:MAG TPA: hypothetical protein VFZ21_30890 [Gemmatimonadaceae bacterium]|nr:hypothetical protein [Gemmatimonadaceae bacterium]
MDACVAVLGGSDTIDGALDFSAFGSDGFTLVVDDAMPDSMRVHYLAIGGTSLTDIDIGFFSEPGATGDQDITAPGFQPDCLLLVSASNSSADPPTAGVDSRVMFGAAAGASPSNYVWAGGSNDTSDPTQCVSYCKSGESVATLSSGTSTVVARASVSSWLSTGFRLNWTEVSGTATRYIYAALKGGSYALGDLLTQTDTTTDIVESGLGFEPKAALFVSHCKTQSTADTAQDDDDWSMGAFSDTSTEVAFGVNDEDGQATTVVATAVEHDNVYVKVASDAVESSMQCIAVGSDGFTCEMTDAAAAQAFVWYLAFGSGAISGSASESIFGASDTGVAAATASASASESIGGATDVAAGAVLVTGTASESIFGASDVGFAALLGQASASEEIGGATDTAEGLANAYVTASESIFGASDLAEGLANIYGSASESVGGASDSVAALLVTSAAADEEIGGASDASFLTISELQNWLEPTPEYRRGLALEMLRRRQH